MWASIHVLGRLLLSTACTSTAPESTSEATAPSPAKEAKTDAVAPRPEYLVWRAAAPTAADAVAYETVRLDADGAVLGRTPGLIAATSEGLWQLFDAGVEFTTPDCNLFDAPAQSETLTHTSRRVALKRLDGSAWLELVGARPSTPDEPLEDFFHHVQVVGSAGPWFFVVESESGYGCGAHGFTGAGLVVVDLERGIAADPLTTQERRRIHARHHVDALKGFATFDPDSPPDDWEPLLTALFPRLNNDRIAIDYQFTTDTCYACGDREWGDYSLSTRVEAQTPPKSLSPHLAVPDGPRDELTTAAGRPTGFTIVPPDHPSLPELPRLFGP